MSNTPYGSALPQPWMPQGFPSQRSSRLPIIIALVLSLLALGLAAAAWFRPVREAEAAAPQYSEQQVADAKKNLCDAYANSYKAVKAAGNVTSEDPNLRYMFALNTRLALNTAADHLLSEVDKNQAAPSRLLVVTTTLAYTYHEFLLSVFAEDSTEGREPISDKMDTLEASIKRECE